MLLGVVGAPNKGKSTFFSAATLVDAQIANYPFTTITPNRGITYVRAPCPHVELGLKGCNAKNSKCVNGVRLVPVGMIDTPGLVPDAHLGKGLGNKFLDSIREADALIQVVDATGKTDVHGNACESCAPQDEVAFLKNEIAMWIVEIMKRKGGAAHGNAGGKTISVKDAATALSGLRIDETMIAHAASACGLDITDGVMPDQEGLEEIAVKLVEKRMPFAVACNKIDVPGAKEKYGAAHNEIGPGVFACSAAVELALRKAAERGLIDYAPGAKSFVIVGQPDAKQAEALEKMSAFLEANGGTGVQQIIDWAVYERLNAIIVYPVEDEHRYCNNKGEVLPDAFLVPKGTVAKQLAAMVHTELASKFIGAIDAKRHIRVGADHVLENGDVVKIVAGH
ncbi:MAG: YchF-related putative GTPase [Candidatus Anstonellaceae archaeon]